MGVFIACSDLHFSERCPVNRLDDDWIGTCCGKFMQVINHSIKYCIPHIVIAGDFFDRFEHNAELVNSVLEILYMYDEIQFYILPGNHDIKSHNLGLLKKSQLMTLNCLDNVLVVQESITQVIDDIVFKFIPFGQPLENKMTNGVVVIHEFVYKEKPWDDAPASGNYKRILKKLNYPKLVISGDNHEFFIGKHKGSTLLNCGGMLRKGIDEIDREPMFHVVNDDFSIESIKYKIDDDVFNHESKKMLEKKDKAIEKVVEQMSNDIEFKSDFLENLKRFLKSNEDIKEEVKQIITEEIEHVN